MIGRGIAARIALAAIASAAVGLVILGVGVAVVGADVFTSLMMEAGDSAEHAREMYDDSVTAVVIAASVLRCPGKRRAGDRHGPDAGPAAGRDRGAARRVADGDYQARVPRSGPEELASLADSFNQMASSLERQEAMRRDFIANAAHELRTPLTNLQGYLEALRDGVITADRATYESLHEEADRLVRLSRSLDALAEGDAGTNPPRLEELDLAGALRSAIDLAAPSIERAGLRLRTEIPEALPARADPDRSGPGPRQPPVQCRPLHADRRIDHGPRRAAAGRRPHLGREYRRRDPGRGSRSTVRAVLPGREVARPGAGGAGIGLAIVKQLVESAGGRVGAESRDGLTRFWFSLPT